MSKIVQVQLSHLSQVFGKIVQVLNLNIEETLRYFP